MVDDVNVNPSGDDVGDVGDKGDTQTPTVLSDETQQALAGLASLPTMIKEGFANIKESLTVKPVEPKPQELSSDAVDRFTNSELVGHVTDVVLGKVKALVEPLSKGISSISKGSQEDRIRTQISELSRKHPDFDEWAGEMRSVLEGNPSLSNNIEDVFMLAKARNPDKVAEIDKKNKAKDGGDQQSNFGGLPSGGSSGEAERTNMDSKEAALSAWDKTMGNILGGPIH